VATQQGNTLTLSLPPGVNSYGVAYLCTQSSGVPIFTNELIIEATLGDDLTSVPGCVNGTFTTASLSGSVDASAISGVGQIQVEAPGGTQLIAGNAGSFTLTAQAGTDDVAFVAEDLSGNVLAVKIVRSQTAPGVLNNGNVVAFLASDATTFEPLTTTNIPAGFQVDIPDQARYLTANGAFFTLSNMAGTQYAVVPASEAQATDDYRFDAAYAGVPQSLVTSELLATSASAVSLSLPVPIPYSAPVPGPFPAFSLNYSGTGVNNYYIGVFWVDLQAGLLSIGVRASAAYQAGATSLAVPDLSSIQGFLTPADSGVLVNWSADVVGGTTGQPGGSDVAWDAEIYGSYTEP
jgi:hypothetical protein